MVLCDEKYFMLIKLRIIYIYIFIKFIEGETVIYKSFIYLFIVYFENLNQTQSTLGSKTDFKL